MALALKFSLLRLGKRVQSNFAANIEAHVVVLESLEADGYKGLFGWCLLFVAVVGHKIGPARQSNGTTSSLLLTQDLSQQLNQHLRRSRYAEARYQGQQKSTQQPQFSTLLNTTQLINLLQYYIK